MLLGTETCRVEPTGTLAFPIGGIRQNHFLGDVLVGRLVLAGEGIWDCFGVFRGDIWALTEQGPPKVVRMSRFC